MFIDFVIQSLSFLSSSNERHLHLNSHTQKCFSSDTCRTSVFGVLITSNILTQFLVSVFRQA
jgi:hypothetical protein